jgi:hypothetical protein
MIVRQNNERENYKIRFPTMLTKERLKTQLSVNTFLPILGEPEIVRQI